MGRPMRGAVGGLLALLAACDSIHPAGSQGPPAHAAAADALAAAPEATGRVVGRGARLLVYLPVATDTYESIAAEFLGSSDQAWQIDEANPGLYPVSGHVIAGEPLVVPLVPMRPLGVSSDGARGVTVLCYHRIDASRGKVTVAPEQFEAQLDWLQSNGYRVVRLADLEDFLAGRRALPQRAVVLTFDDGYESVFRNAFPLLRQRGVPATVFVYSDFIGTRDGLSWADLEEMQRSGLVDVQAHSKSHVNLVDLGREAGTAARRERVEAELVQPRALIERRLGAAGAQVRDFAYPYGEADAVVLDAMRREGYALGLTVTPGSNSFYASPLLLRRVMVFAGTSLEDFRRRLEGARSSPPAP